MPYHDCQLTNHPARRFPTFTLVGAACLLAIGLIYASGRLTEDSNLLFANIAFPAAVVGASALLWRASWRLRGRERVAWSLVAAGLTVVGDRE